jgi:hypothetical protein
MLAFEEAVADGRAGQALVETRQNLGRAGNRADQAFQGQMVERVSHCFHDR